MRIREKRRRTNLAARFLVLIFGVAALAVAGILAVTLLPGLVTSRLGAGSPSLNPAERALRCVAMRRHLGHREQGIRAGHEPRGGAGQGEHGATNPGAGAGRQPDRDRGV